MGVYGLYLAFRDSRTPLAAKVAIVLIVAYPVSPIDPIPTRIPGAGYLDEFVTVPVSVTFALWFIPEPVMAESRQRAGEDLEIPADASTVCTKILTEFPLERLFFPMNTPVRNGNHAGKEQSNPRVVP